MKDEIKEIKIGMYTTDEILEFMTNGEGRGFMGRSMYDAIIDYITNLQEENKHLNLQLDQALKDYDEELTKRYKAIEMLNELNIKLKDILKTKIDIKDISDIKQVLGDKENE